MLSILKVLTNTNIINTDSVYKINSWGILVFKRKKDLNIARTTKNKKEFSLNLGTKELM
jgi:hypothetical protein